VTDEFLPAGAIELDASLSENHSLDSEITQFPVEGGADISDHIRIKPRQLTITGVVTNHPIRLLASVFEEPDRAAKAFDKLKEIRDNRELVTVLTTLEEYENMVLTTVQIPRDVRRGQAVEATMTFREALIADSETIDLPEPVSKADTATRSPPADQGTQAKGAASPAEATQSKSILSSTLRFGR
jgi:hypothetical protein